MKYLLAALLPLLLVACRRPEVEAFAQHPSPIVVTFQMPRGYPQNAAMGSEYAAVLRAKLATCAMVVPDGETAPDPATELQVTITRIRSHVDPAPAAIGVATGLAVGTLSAMAGDRDAFFDGLFWGLWAGTAAADARAWDDYRLGYDPTRVSAVVKLQQPGIKRPLLDFSVGGGEVIAQMTPLRPGDRYDLTRIREEEAKAFAKVVVSRLRERFHWLPLAEPSYYKQPVPLPTP